MKYDTPDRPYWFQLNHSQIVWGGSAYSWTSFLEEGGHSII